MGAAKPGGMNYGVNGAELSFGLIQPLFHLFGITHIGLKIKNLAAQRLYFFNLPLLLFINGAATG